MKKTIIVLLVLSIGAIAFFFSRWDKLNKPEEKPQTQTQLPVSDSIWLGESWIRLCYDGECGLWTEVKQGQCPELPTPSTVSEEEGS